ncbi:hypothetical protein DFAR_670003 [Desulfarculales bacterium]
MRLEVSDDGLGMDKETSAHIFKPFFTTKPQGQGIGLVLSTVYGIVNNYGSLVLCHRRPQQGAAFTIYLPARPEGLPELGLAPRQLAETATGSKTILVVDDKPAILETCRQTLE